MNHSLVEQVLQWTVFLAWALWMFTAHYHICLWDDTEKKTHRWLGVQPKWKYKFIQSKRTTFMLAFSSIWLPGEETFGAYHRTLFQVWVAPWGDPATMGIWIGLLAQGTMLSSFRPRALQVASKDCSFNSIPSSRWLTDPVKEINRFWKQRKM